MGRRDTGQSYTGVYILTATIYICRVGRPPDDHYPAPQTGEKKEERFQNLCHEQVGRYTRVRSKEASRELW